MVAVLSADHWTVTVPVFGAYVVGAVVCTRSILGLRAGLALRERSSVLLGR